MYTLSRREQQFLVTKTIWTFKTDVCCLQNTHEGFSSIYSCGILNTTFVVCLTLRVSGDLVLCVGNHPGFGTAMSIRAELASLAGILISRCLCPLRLNGSLSANSSRLEFRCLSVVHWSKLSGNGGRILLGLIPKLWGVFSRHYDLCRWI